MVWISIVIHRQNGAEELKWCRATKMRHKAALHKSLFSCNPSAFSRECFAQLLHLVSVRRWAPGPLLCVSRWHFMRQVLNPELGCSPAPEIQQIIIQKRWWGVRAAKASMILSSSLGLESAWGAFGLGLSSSLRKDLANKPEYGVTKCSLFLASDQLGFSEPWKVSSAPGARMEKIHVNLLAGCYTFSLNFCISHGNLT